MQCQEWRPQTCLRWTVGRYVGTTVEQRLSSWRVCWESVQRQWRSWRRAAVCRQQTDDIKNAIRLDEFSDRRHIRCEYQWSLGNSSGTLHHGRWMIAKFYELLPVCECEVGLRAQPARSTAFHAKLAYSWWRHPLQKYLMVFSHKNSMEFPWNFHIILPTWNHHGFHIMKIPWQPMGSRPW